MSHLVHASRRLVCDASARLNGAQRRRCSTSWQHQRQLTLAGKDGTGTAALQQGIWSTLSDARAVIVDATAAIPQHCYYVTIDSSIVASTTGQHDGEHRAIGQDILPR